MNKRMKIIKEVAIRADLFREQTGSFGQMAKDAFSENKTQLRSLENIANSALKASDVMDYIKRQTGKSKTNIGWKKDQFGTKLLNKIENDLASDRDRVVRNLSVTDEKEKLEIYLLLIRDFIKQVVIHYEFKSGE